MADYPNSIKTFSTLVDLIDSVLAHHQNERGAEITAIETELGLAPSNVYSDVAAAITGLMSGWIPGSVTWSYSSADAPTFVISIPQDVTSLIGPGCRIKLTQTTVKYFIVTAVGAYSGGVTLVTVYGGTDYTLDNAAITLPFYSRSKAPFGFPLDPSKWTVTASDTSDRTQASPTAGTWYNLGSFSASLPIGLWRVSWRAVMRPLYNTGTAAQQRTTLSTANNSASDPDFIVITTVGANIGNLYITTTLTSNIKILNLAAKTTYYLNAMTALTTDSLNHLGSVTPTQIKAECAYL